MDGNDRKGISWDVWVWLVIIGLLVVLLFSPLTSTRGTGVKIDYIKRTASAAGFEPVVTDYAKYHELVTEDKIKQELGHIASHQSRVHGYPGNLATANYIRDELQKIGLEKMMVDDVKLAVPIDKGASIQVLPDGQTIRLYCLWPNLVRTSTLPPEGIVGHLVYGRQGLLKDFNGREMRGAILLLDFDCEDRFIDARALGVRAVIFIEPATATRGEAERKFLETPVNIPRFWVSKGDGQSLVELATKEEAQIEAVRQAVKERNLVGRIEKLEVSSQRVAALLDALRDDPPASLKPLADAGDGQALLRLYEGRTVSQVRVNAKMVWENAVSSNIYGFIPGRSMKDEIIVIEAYYDSMSVVPALSPGAEQACGIVAFLNLARIFKQYPPERTVMFLATTGHCENLAGVCSFLYSHSRTSDFKDKVKDLAAKALFKDDIDFKLFFGLDLTSQSDALGVFYRGHYMSLGGREDFYNQRFFAPFGKTLVDSYAGHITIELALGKFRRAYLESLEDKPDELSKEVEAFAKHILSASAESTVADLVKWAKDEKVELDEEALEKLLSFMEEKRFVSGKLERQYDLAQVAEIEKAVATHIAESRKDVDGKIKREKVSEWNREQKVPADEELVRKLIDRFESDEIPSTVVTKFVYEMPTPLQNCISPIGGKTWESFVPGNVALDAEAVIRTGRPGMTLLTVNDARIGVDTPLDKFESVNRANLTSQVKFLACLFANVLNDEGLFPDFELKLRDYAKTLVGRVVEFDFVENPNMPDKPVSDTIVAMGQPTWKKSYMGVRPTRFAMSDEKGRFIQDFVFEYSVTLEPYKVDSHRMRVRFDDPAEALKLLDLTGYAEIEELEDGAHVVPMRAKEVLATTKVGYQLLEDHWGTGKIIYAADRGQRGAEFFYPLQIRMDWAFKPATTVAFRCEPIDIFGKVDPRYLRDLNFIQVLGPEDYPPQNYGYAELRPGDGTTIFVKPGAKVKVIMGSSVLGIQYIMSNATPDSPRGKAFSTADDIVQDGAMVHSRYRVTSDMFERDDSWIAELEKYSIRNERLKVLHEEARLWRGRAESALKQQRYDEYVSAIRKSRGFEARAYPEVKSTAKGTVYGIVFYFALLVPFALFAERLLFCYSDIRKQIAATSGIFILVFVVLRFVHPAFFISRSPYVIFLAFVILAMAVFVIGFVVRKFNEQIGEMRRQAAKIHQADVGRMSASVAAFLLGISNMKKRKVRTMLTTVTLVLLTFTVLSFTSVTSYIKFNRIELGHPPEYNGALIRDRNWNELTPHVYNYVYSAFGQREDVYFAPRCWYYSTTTPTHIKISTAEGKHFDASAAVGVTPQEIDVLVRPDVLLKPKDAPEHTWFETRGEDACVLPSAIAHRLGIGAEDIGKKDVFIFGRPFVVKAILDSEKLVDLKDLDGEALAPIDVTEENPGFGQQETVTTLQENVTELKTFAHMSMDNVVILPYEFLMDLGATLRSIALRFEPQEGEDFVADVMKFMERVAMTIFVGQPNPGGQGTVTAYSSIALSAMGGLKGLFIPIVIAALIVLNTMLGSVYERYREIGIYSSVGLAPVHIASLFMAESCVYAVIGSVLGYLLGQVSAFVITHGNLLEGLTLNYSATSAVFSTMLVIAVVLLSTIYPARKASSMAVPDVTRRWRFPDPDGDDWTFDFPFTVASRQALGLYMFLNNYFDGYKEESVGSFYTDNVAFAPLEGEYGLGYLIQMRSWLAPFDMGISQDVELRAIQTEDEGIARIELYIHRLSGDVSSWKRVNKGFLREMRKQFLIWRTVPDGVKETYANEGERLLAEMGHSVEQA